MKQPLYLPITLLLILLSGLNYFHTEFLAFFPGFLWWSIPLISVVLLLAILFLISVDRKNLSQLEYEFINVVTHTFRTPTTVIKWSIDGLRKSDHALEIVDDTNQIESSNERMIELLDILIDYSSLISEEQYTFSAISFREITEAILKKFAPKMREKNITLTLNIPSSLPLITADTKRLQFVIETLLQNAISYTQPTGSITITIEQIGRALRLSITDNGMGILWKDSGHLFKKFFRSHTATVADPQGLGLGLYIARKIIGRHKGKIWFISKGENKGSTFYLEVPQS